MRRVYRLLLLALVVGTALACYTTTATPAILSFSPAELPEAHVGQPYSVTITISNTETPAGQIEIEDGALPPGLAIQHEWGANSVQISGTAEETGTFEFTIYAACLGTSVSGQKGYQQYELVVK